VAGQDEFVDLARPAPLSHLICQWAMGVFGQWRSVPISAPQFVSGRWDNKSMRRFLLCLAIVIGSVALGNTEAIAAGNNWMLGNPKQDLVIEYFSDNSLKQCGITKNKFTIDYSVYDKDYNAGSWNNCFLNVYLPKTIVYKTTDDNFSQFVSDIYYEVQIKNSWRKDVNLIYNPDTEETPPYLNVAQRIPMYAPKNTEKVDCQIKSLGGMNYIAKSTTNMRVAIVLNNKSSTVLYSKPFTVSYVNHPEAWLKACSSNSANNPIPAESNASTAGSSSISCPAIGAPVKYEFVWNPPYEDDREIKLKISNSSSCAITVAVSGQVVCQHRPAYLESIRRFNRTIIFSKVTSNVFNPKTSGIVTVDSLFPSNSVTYKDCNQSPIPIEPQTKLPTKTKLIGPYLIYDSRKDTLSVTVAKVITN